VNDPRNVCPDGWHVPTLNELTTLVNFLGGEEVAGGKLKGILSWTAPNVGADNSSGFSGQPGGARFETGVFGNQLDAGFWWTQTPGDGNGAWCLSLTNTAASAGISSANQQNGFSVRCVRD
jgi:uncharacterized protein (TIGR02145 family)